MTLFGGGGPPPVLRPPAGIFWRSRILEAFILALAPRISFGGLRITAATQLHLTTNIGMAGAGKSPAAMGLSLTPSFGASAFSNQADVVLHLTPSLVMDAVGPLNGVFALSRTLSVGMTGAEKYARTLGVALTPSIGMGGVGHMPVQIVGTNINTGNTVTIPTHQVGDLILIYSYRSAFGNAPTVPTAAGTVPTWTTIRSGDAGDGGGNVGARLTRTTATATNHTSGTFTGSTKTAAIVIRNQASSPIGGNAMGGGLGGPSTAPSVTMTKTDGTSLLIHFHGTGDGSNASDIDAAAPTGYTVQALSNGSAVQGSIAVDTKNVTTSDGACDHTADLAWFRSATVEILAP